MTTLGRVCRAALCVVPLLLVGATAASTPAGAEAAPTPTIANEEEAEMQASVLAVEDRRLIEIRTITSLARWQGKNWKTPYRLGTPVGYTLVLTPRSSPYTVEDLLELAPQTFVPMSDGSYLLTEHVVVMPRATLTLSVPGGLTLRLGSGHGGFSTIVSLGGELEILGEASAPVTITSWDVDAGAEDDLLTDGRAYVRAIGGQFVAQHVDVHHLGFWSGRTGGLALTGTDRPNTGAIESVNENSQGPIDPASLLDGVTWQPAGPIPLEQRGPNLKYSVPAQDYVSSRMSNVTSHDNAFGLFVSGANGLQVRDSEFTDNSLGGVLLHRYVTNGTISRTTSMRNQGDGFSLDRATTSIAITEAESSHNTGSGYRLAGRPLADGPSAVGASLRSYGNNSVSNSTARANGHYGIEVFGGFNIGLSNNLVDGHEMGIMVNGPATRVSITGNTVRNSQRHGVALVNNVSESTVTGNVIEGSATGMYVRDSVGQIRGNTVQAARTHGVSLVGQVHGSDVSQNVLAGTGTSAIETARSSGDFTTSTNYLEGWHDSTPWYYGFKQLTHPLSALWSALAALLAVTALRGRRTGMTKEHPYHHQMIRPGRVAVPQPANELRKPHAAAVR